MSNSWICVDASLVVRLVADPQDETVQQLVEQWHSSGRQLVAPTLLHYEVTNALHRYQQHGLMSGLAVQLAQKAALSLPLQLVGNPDLHQQALILASQFELPATYDAHYLALAETLGAEFWTADRRLVRKVKDAFPWVHLLQKNVQTFPRSNVPLPM